MTKLYAIVDANGLIVNTVLWDGVPCSEAGEGESKVIIGWNPPENHTAVQIDGAHIGGTYINGIYSRPPDA